jgi:putative ABC transport system substrate-binding protein
MRRREFVTLLGGAAVAWPLAARAQQPAMPVIGFLEDVATKRLELLHEMVSAAMSIAVLSNPANRAHAAETRELQVAARVLGLRLLALNASSLSDIETAFAILVQQRVGGLLVSTDNLFSNLREQLATLAARHMVPAMHGYREYVAVGRILKGEKPADLPVQQATKVELTINLKTAKSLGLTVPTALLVRADEVIE